MLILRVRQSEVALTDGRLDEAYDLAVAHDVGRHRRGQRLITRLAAALVKRGNTHLAAGQPREALNDCEKAAKIAGNLPEIVALRTAAVDAISDAQRAERRQARALAVARQRIDHGHLTLGEKLLADVSPEVSTVGTLKNDIEHRRHVAVEAAHAARDAFKRGDVKLASEQIAKARAADPNDDNVLDLAPKIDSALREEFQAALEEGRLDALSDLAPQTGQQRLILDHLRDASSQIASNDFAEARITLARLEPMLTNARWLKQLVQQLDQAQSATTQLRVSPLAWLENRSQQRISPQPRPAIRWSPSPDPRPPFRPVKMDTLPSQLLLQADGVGSFLIFRRPQITIAPVSSSIRADLPVVAEATAAPVSIERMDDDYFLKPSNRLLSSGDKIDLSPRCRFTFVLPSAASTSAALDLTGARLPRGDVRRVILMDHDLIIGSSKSCHICAEGVDKQVVLHVRDGQLFCQHKPIALGEHTSVGDFHFVVTSAADAPPHRAAALG